MTVIQADRQRSEPGNTGGPPRRRPVRPRWSLLPAVLFLLLVLGWTVWPALFTPFDPLAGGPQLKLLPPDATHWFGTDQLGRDVYARVVFGAADSVSSALLAVLIGLILGSITGLLGGFLGGWVDTVLARIIEVVLSIPGLLFTIIVIAALGASSRNAAIAVGLLSSVQFARVMRSEVLSVRKRDFVEAAYLIGGTRLSVVLGHVLPNSLRSVGALAILHFGSAILAISSLAFLGYGDPPPTPDWGLLVAEGKDYLSRYPWIVLLPGLVVVATVLSIHRLSSELQRSIGDRS